MGITDGMYQLGKAAQRLNHGSDELNRTLASIDEILGRLGIGMDYTHPRPLHEDTQVGPDQKRIIEMGFLAYGRHKGQFRLLYRTLKVLEGRKAMANEGPGSVQPLLEAPRRIRHLAIDHLPELVGGLADSVDSVLNQLDRRKEVASQVLAQLEAMLSGGGTSRAVEPAEQAPASDASASGERRRRRTAAGHLGHTD